MLLHTCSFVSVDEVLAIAGGFESGSVLTDWAVVMAGGKECEDHGLPELPESLEGFGLTQSYNQDVYLCGGKVSTTCKST